MRTSGSLSPHVQQLAEIFQWLKERDDARRGYDWAMSNANAEEHAIAHPDEDDQEQEVLPF